MRTPMKPLQLGDHVLVRATVFLQYLSSLEWDLPYGDILWEPKAPVDHAGIRCLCLSKCPEPLHGVIIGKTRRGTGAYIPSRHGSGYYSDEIEPASIKIDRFFTLWMVALQLNWVEPTLVRDVDLEKEVKDVVP